MKTAKDNHNTELNETLREQQGEGTVSPSETEWTWPYPSDIDFGASFTKVEHSDLPDPDEIERDDESDLVYVLTQFTFSPGSVDIETRQAAHDAYLVYLKDISPSFVGLDFVPDEPELAAPLYQFTLAGKGLVLLAHKQRLYLIDGFLGDSPTELPLAVPADPMVWLTTAQNYLTFTPAWPETTGYSTPDSQALRHQWVEQHVSNPNLSRPSRETVVTGALLIQEDLIVDEVHKEEVLIQDWQDPLTKDFYHRELTISGGGQTATEAWELGTVKVAQTRPRLVFFPHQDNPDTNPKKHTIYPSCSYIPQKNPA